MISRLHEFTATDQDGNLFRVFYDFATQKRTRQPGRQRDPEIGATTLRNSQLNPDVQDGRRGKFNVQHPPRLIISRFGRCMHRQRLHRHDATGFNEAIVEGYRRVPRSARVARCRVPAFLAEREAVRCPSSNRRRAGRSIPPTSASSTRSMVSSSTSMWKSSRRTTAGRTQPADPGFPVTTVDGAAAPSIPTWRRTSYDRVRLGHPA